MTKCAPVWRLLLFLCLVISFVGCSQFKRSGVAEEKDPHFLEGKRRAGGLDWKGAIESYERALQSNPNNSSAHFELALLHDKQLNDHAAAIYHYQKHLTLNTNSPHKDFAQVQVKYCKQELARTHSYAVINRDVQQHLDRLSATNEAYRQRIDLLEAELARGPRYITNYVTNWVTVPQFESGQRTMTRPTTIVEAPQPRIEDVAPEPQVQERPRTAPQTQRATSTREVAAQRESGSRNGSARPSGTRATPQQSGRAAASSSSRLRSHRVVPGDTMAEVAKKYNITVAELKKANPGLGSGTRAGQVLNIPEK